MVALTGSNRRHSACKADALPTELSALSEDHHNITLSEDKRKQNSLSNSYTSKYLDLRKKDNGAATGLEPATLGVTGRYSNQLNYRCVVYGGR